MSVVIGGGKYRSRIIQVPSYLLVPTKSIVRMAAANALGEKLIQAQVLDLFAGSGALGLEALSRGAAWCDFFDCNPEAIKVVKDNLSSLKETNAEVRLADYENALEFLASQKKTYDIVFLDPPYAMKEIYAKVPSLLLEKGLLNPGAAVVLEYEGAIEPPVSSYARNKTYNYGKSRLMILWRQS